MMKSPTLAAYPVASPLSPGQVVSRELQRVVVVAGILLLGLIGACGHGRGSVTMSDPGKTDDAAITRLLIHASGVAGADSQVDAVAMSGAVITSVGRSQDLQPSCTGTCVVMDVAGAFISPGFHDAHVHLPVAAEEAGEAEVSGARVASIQAALRQWIASHPGAPWILAHGVNLGAFVSLPTKADLDAVEAVRPVVVRDSTLHNVWVNSAALAVAGVTASTMVPGGRIVHDSSGEPTGILYDYAARLVIDKEPAPAPADLQAVILAAQRTSLAAGYTATQGGPVSRAEADAYVALDAAGSLVQRTFLWAPLGGSDAAFQAWLDFAAQLPSTGHVQVVAFKGFVDGTLPARTAALLAPYSDDSSTSGALIYSQDALNALVTRANRAGYPVALHAVGDRAVRAALDAFEASARTLSTKLLNRIEHADLVDPADVSRFASLGVVASVQPTFIFYRSRASALFLDRLGPDRGAHAFAWRALAQSDAVLAFGTDYPVGGLGEDPITGMFCAIRREFADGTPWEPGQAVDPDAALEAYTATPARIIGWGDRIGRIVAGYQADLVLLADDPRHAAVMGLASNPIRGVLVGGAPQ
jgi:predicted amidohydrolase YtcJ